METEAFLAAVKALTERSLTIVDLVEVADSLKGKGRLDLVGPLYRLWIEFNKESPLLYAAYFNYAITMAEGNDLAAAREAFERAIELNPDFSPAYVNLGGVLEKQGSLGEAVSRWQSLVDRLSPVTGSAIKFKITALRQMGRALQASGQLSTLEGIFKQSLEIDSAQRDIAEQLTALRMSLCRWPALEAFEGVNRETLMRSMHPLSAAAYADDPLFQLATAWDYSRKTIGHKIPPLAPAYENTSDPANPARLRIGYVSSDMCNHAVGYLMTELFERLHERNRVETVIYYNGAAANDSISSRIKSAVNSWVDINSMDDTTAAQRIQTDGIHILVDLNGHTKGARTGIFALRPTPVAVNWLGFPGSMGSPYHHYLIADDWIIPQQHEIYMSEAVVRLPCYQPNDRHRVVSPNRPSRQDVGLPEDAMVYCCFNGVQKLNRRMFERWLTILEQVPQSVLWLLEGHEEARKTLHGIASQAGVAPDRLIFAKSLPNADHLARYPLADLFLDTFPYGAHTTASDALWMGVPILTQSGHSFASRVCGSLTIAAGLPELVCHTPEDYVERAIVLGRAPDQILRYKAHLEAARGTCTLFDMDRLTDHLEQLYEGMWSDLRRGDLPRPDLAGLESYLDLASEEDLEASEIPKVEGYHAWYRQKLSRRHASYPIAADHRLWTSAER